VSIKNLLRIIVIYLRGCNTSSDSGIILHYARMAFIVIFRVLMVWVVLKPLLNLDFSLEQNQTLSPIIPFFPNNVDLIFV
jgi:hypothetical protein